MKKSNENDHLVTDTLVYENFEQHINSYLKSADIKFKSGIWRLNDATVAKGNPYADPSNYAVRIRNRGKLEMRFDITPAADLFFSVTSSIYGMGEPSEWGLFMSRDKGATYRCLFAIHDTAHFERKVFFIEKPTKGPIRLEIKKLSGYAGKINFDDVLIYSVEERK